MRVFATATATSRSNAVGQIELACTAAGLSLGLYGLGSYAEGYAVGALAQGTRVMVPWSEVRAARATDDELYLELDSPGFPHDRLSLSRFQHGPGVPWPEIRKRRLLLHLTALSIGAAATAIAAVWAPRAAEGSVAWGAFGYGALAAVLVLLLGYGFDQRLYLRPPLEEETRRSFLLELERYYPGLERTNALPEPERPLELPNLAGLLPRTATVLGITLAAALLTAIVTSQRLLEREEARNLATASPRVFRGEAPDPLDDEPAPVATPAAAAPAPTEPAEPPASTPAPSASGDLVVERRCLCDRADSPLWQKPIPRLSTLLLEKRVTPTKTSAKTRLEVAVVNNGDAPVEEITLHVQFFEGTGRERRPTKERPLYFEGPLLPGRAIKWSAEARGTDFEIASPDIGALGTNGEGAAPADTFVQLLEARHRPVRLHAVRMLSYLGDSRARAAALTLKDALRAAESPYLRRVLSALHDVRTCDVEIQADAGQASLGACVFNAADEEQSGLGLQIHVLERAFDASQPLANPPESLAEKKWALPEALGAQAGRYVRVKLPADFPRGASLVYEAEADRLDLLE